MKKIVLLVLFTSLLINPIRSQILDVPYRSDLWGCGVWCWARSSQIVLLYYGNDLYLCDILDYVRSLNPSAYGTNDCCVDPDSCCHGGPYLTQTTPNSVYGILNNWSLASTPHSSYLSTSAIQTKLSNNRLFIAQRTRIATGGEHVLVVYGYLSGDLYLQNSGLGSEIYDYNDFITGSNGLLWNRTLTMNSSASSCPLTQHIIGEFWNAVSINKAQQDIFAECLIHDNSDVTFQCGRDIILESGFEIELGGVVELESGATITCP